MSRKSLYWRGRSSRTGKSLYWRRTSPRTRKSLYWRGTSSRTRKSLYWRGTSSRTRKSLYWRGTSSRTRTSLYWRSTSSRISNDYEKYKLHMLWEGDYLEKWRPHACGRVVNIPPLMISRWNSERKVFWYTVQWGKIIFHHLSWKHQKYKYYDQYILFVLYYITGLPFIYTQNQ